jgi:predicted enzyme related to lactoylglutathione lyase
MFGTQQVKVMAEFYEKVFGKKPDMNDGSFYGWSVGNTFFSIGEHSEVMGSSKEPQRILMNFESKEVKEEYDRISKIEGVKIVKELYEMGGAQIATFADPDGNYFQLMTPWDDVENALKQ